MHRLNFTKTPSWLLLLSLLAFLVVSFFIFKFFHIQVLAATSVTLTSPTEGSYVGFGITVSADVLADSGVERVDFYWDTTNLIATDNSAPYSRFWVTNSAPEGAHTVTAKSYENSTGLTSTATVNIIVDRTAPTTSLTYPTLGTYIRGIVNVSANASDNYVIDRVEFYRDTNIYYGTSYSSPYSYSLNTTSLPDGNHSLFVKAFDKAGNQGSSSSVSITVDNTNPAVTLTAPVNGATLTGPTTLTATASDNVFLDQVEFYRDGLLIGVDTSSPYSLSWNPGTTTDGSHSFYARALDHAGNSAQSVTNTANVAVVPTTLITSPVKGAIVPRGQVTVISADATDNDGIASVKFYVNGALKCTDTVAPYSCNWKVPAQRNKTYTLQTKAYDTTGNSEGVSSTITVTSSN